MNLFYAPDLTNKITTYDFDKEESRHIIKSLRKKKGDILHIANGKGDWFDAEITKADPKKTEVKIIKHTPIPPRNFRLHVAIAPTKSNDRFEWFLEKATEIGIDEITPLLCRYSERKKINKDRYERILVSAMKQSLQAYKPKLNALTSFADFIRGVSEAADKFIAYCQAERPLISQIKPGKDVLILIGPEGGFSLDEIEQARSAGFIPVSLSPNRLRTETAGLLSVTSVQLKNMASKTSK